MPASSLSPFPHSCIPSLCSCTLRIHLLGFFRLCDSLLARTSVSFGFKMKTWMLFRLYCSLRDRPSSSLVCVVKVRSSLRVAILVHRPIFFFCFSCLRQHQLDSKYQPSSALHIWEVDSREPSPYFLADHCLQFGKDSPCWTTFA